MLQAYFCVTLFRSKRDIVSGGRMLLGNMRTRNGHSCHRTNPADAARSDFCRFPGAL
jgi:hypothetical protein